MVDANVKENVPGIPSDIQMSVNVGDQQPGCFSAGVNDWRTALASCSFHNLRVRTTKLYSWVLILTKANDLTF